MEDCESRLEAAEGAAEAAEARNRLGAGLSGDADSAGLSVDEAGPSQFFDPVFEEAARAAAAAVAGLAPYDPTWKTSEKKIMLMETNHWMQHDIVMSTERTIHNVDKRCRERCREERRSTKKAWRLASEQEAIAAVRQLQYEEELAKAGCPDCQKRRAVLRTARRDGGIPSE